MKPFSSYCQHDTLTLLVCQEFLSMSMILGNFVLLSHSYHIKRACEHPTNGNAHRLSDIFRYSASYTDSIVERNPSCAALQPSPAGGRAFSGLDFHDGVHTNGNKLRPAIFRPRSSSDIEVGDGDPHKERHLGRCRRSSCFRCVYVYTVYIKHTISRILIGALLGILKDFIRAFLRLGVRPGLTDAVYKNSTRITGRTL